MSTIHNDVNLVALQKLIIEADAEIISQPILDAMYQGSYEYREAHIVSRTLSANDRVLEIGAGIGFLTCLMAKILQNKETLVSFEASSELIAVIERNLKRNAVQATIFNGVVSNTCNASEDFYFGRDFWSNSVLYQPDARIISVPNFNFEDLIQQFKPTYLTIDIEGSEHELLLSSSLNGVQKICLEVHPLHLSSVQMREIFAHLDCLGFSADMKLSWGQVFYFEKK